MQPLNLTPLQSRLLKYVVSTCLCLTLWASLTPRHGAYATELPLALHHDPLSQLELHALPSGDLVPIEDDNEAMDNTGSDGYVPDFALFDRSLVGRQEPEVNKLANNQKKVMPITPGEVLYFVLEKRKPRIIRTDEDTLEALDARGGDNVSGEEAAGPESDGPDDNEEPNELRKRQAGSRVWISTNTCRQPVPNVNDNGTTAATNPPQLVMYVSTSTQNQKPGPNATDHLATNSTGVVFDHGYTGFEVQANADVYIGIAAPKLDKDWFGSWEFEVAVSTDGLFHSHNNTTPFLYMIDTDSESALFISFEFGASNATEEVEGWREHNPFNMYAFQAGDRTPITGMEHSYCALKEQFNSNSTKDFTISKNVTMRYGGRLPNSQFHVQDLDTATTYNAFVVVEGTQDGLELPGVGKVRGGGKVFQQIVFTTKADDSCQVIFDLDFCDSVAYAVPSSSTFKLNDTGLKELYDNQARSYYQNFSRSLAQIACDTTAEAQYSLARNCTDCENDYKSWLCTVAIPRCEDWTANGTWLQPRNINAPFPNGTLTFDNNVTKEFNETHRDRFAYSKSRNPMIDELIKPGPYKEMKPCQDLCFDIVRSCPAKLNFACPIGPAVDHSYGRRDPSGDTLTCNFPGAVVKLNVKAEAGAFRYNIKNVVMVASLVATMLLWL
ncbi:calcium channel subunit Mid1 [Cucurbitaria berberidis CBS 394.84]|uniref:Calcium channel subunit Mid1 n=1 Tax=Cucurbitaria berberidis CBS 394.84 TaxID=1168544 RepID=A0A9P4GGJ4_9PLEO|nr:calcium channel subunit Mid1 [Cucurbitaria berberidis CBS 394.84]KAF1844824.1 calcium channel subunit Mid1 [Cucurbitaria berberidis CBS 394.84]